MEASKDSLLNCSRCDISDTQQYNDVLIEEVKKRRLLWDRKNEDHFNRRKTAKEWEVIAKILGGKLSSTDLKSKWRNLKDSFYRELKRLIIPPTGLEDRPIMEYYTGQWIHFEKLMFLRDTRKSKQNTCQHGNKDSKIDELDSNDIEYEDSETHEDKNFSEVMITHNLDNTEHNPFENCHDLKRSYSEDSEEFIDSRRRKVVPEEKEPIIYDSDIDEDSHFVKSIVPFLRRLNPVRKLIVRNEIHNILLKELLCNRCKTQGIQPNCSCNNK